MLKSVETKKTFVNAFMPRQIYMLKNNNAKNK